MAEVDFMSVLHKSTQRDYLARVNDPEFPKAKAAQLAKQFAYDYWDGDRRICYGGYRYLEGRWEKVARAMAEHYQLPPKPKILDIGCGKGFLLYDFLKVIPDAEIHGIDISPYAIANSKEEIRDRLQVGTATQLPWPDNYFDLVISITTLHNLHAYDEAALAWEQVPLGRHDEMPERLRVIYETIARRLDDPSERVLLHQEEFGDRLVGVIAGYLLYTELIPEGPAAIMVAERLTGRELGATGREIVASTVDHGIVRSA